MRTGSDRKYRGLHWLHGSEELCSSPPQCHLKPILETEWRWGVCMDRGTKRDQEGKWTYSLWPDSGTTSTHREESSKVKAFHKLFMSPSRNDKVIEMGNKRTKDWLALGGGHR